MKYSQYLGVLAAASLVFSCTLQWTWHPDIKEYFTAFYSLENIYGKPGKVFIFMAAIATLFFLVKKIWAKRWNLMVCGLNLAYAVKTFILFSSCYRGICPEKQPGLWVMITSAGVMMIAAVLPDLKLSSKEPANA